MMITPDDRLLVGLKNLKERIQIDADILASKDLGEYDKGRVQGMKDSIKTIDEYTNRLLKSGKVNQNIP
jgi:hypothetical protein